jgi:hypothetical protein
MALDAPIMQPGDVVWTLGSTGQTRAWRVQPDGALREEDAGYAAVAARARTARTTRREHHRR